MRIDETCTSSQLSRDQLDKCDGLTIEPKIIQSSIPKNLVTMRLVHSRVTTKIGPTTKDIITGTSMSVLRFSEPIVAFEEVLQLED